MTIAHWPTQERPREKLMQHGAAALSDAELLAILLRTGCRGVSARDLAHGLLQQFGGLAGLGTAELDEISAVPGMGHVKAVTMQALFALARRWCEQPVPHTSAIGSSHDLYQRYRVRLRALGREHFLAIALDAKNRILREHQVVGDRHSAPASPRAIFAHALACQAVAIAIVHNHPSGDPVPSPADHQITTHLATTGRLLDIPLLDHVIIGEHRYFSFRDQGLLDDTSAD